jgi:hypothetical protein
MFRRPFGSDLQLMHKANEGHLRSHLTLHTVLAGVGVAAHSAHCASGQCEANLMSRAQLGLQPPRR